MSPWGWLALAILLAAAEMLTVSLVLIWAAGAAAMTGIALWIWPGLPLAAQAALFALGAIAFTFGGRALVLRFGDGAAETGLNRRTSGLIGREARVVAFSGPEGQVTIDGVPWRANLTPGTALPAPGAAVRVTAVDGIVLTVAPPEHA